MFFFVYHVTLFHVFTEFFIFVHCGLHTVHRHALSLSYLVVMFVQVGLLKRKLEICIILFSEVSYPGM